MNFPKTHISIKVLSTALAFACSGAFADELSFNRDVQPILAEYCYHCHGPDAGTRKPLTDPLRLDIDEFALAVRQGGHKVIIPGDGAGSEVVQRMRSGDPLDIMPPPEMHHEVSEEQIAIIERWIDQGAEYEPHWSFVPPERPDVPEVDGSWGDQPIDAFLHVEMARQGLTPNPPEDPARLIRRATLDITGLPPTPEEVREFLNDPRPDAYEHVVDRLLETPAHAEQMARYWLDAARYADTHGIHIDNYRSIWPYRDWVVAAFKENMPFDQFSIEQLAGDLLPEPTLEQHIATGFNRCLPTTGEGGAINEEYEAIYMMDRVETTSGVWLGLTMACAACHDHKFDPVTAEDYFAFAAFFDNTTMHPMDRNNADHPPNIFVPPADERQRWSELETELARIDNETNKHATAVEDDIVAWLAGFDPDMPDASFQQASDDLVKLTGRHGVDVADASEATAANGTAPFSFGLTLKYSHQPTGTLVSRMDADNDRRGWELSLSGGRVTASFIEEWPGKALVVTTLPTLPRNQWTDVRATYDPSLPVEKRASIFINGVEAALRIEHATLDEGSIATDVPLRLGARHAAKPPDANAPPNDRIEVRNFAFHQRALTPTEAFAMSQLPKEKPDEKQARAHYLAHIHPVTTALHAEKRPLDSEIDAIRERGSLTLVMEEKADSDPVTHFLERGDYQSPSHLVKANTPSSLPPLPEGTRADRLAMAEWLFDPENPLTARVAVNRLWTQVFGTGIVETTEDFGLMGSHPSHPELIDWLAIEFLESGWDQRHILRLILTSQAYRQSATWNEEKAEIDPDNLLLARGPRLRLDGEVIRDIALSASGLLVDKIGGPPVKPYQPEGVWEAVAMPQSNTRFYKQDEGDALYRRSLYTFWKRTAPHPAMEIFNAPTRETFCTRRERSNTPLQALVLMNDPQFVEACRVLADSVLRQHDTTAARLEEVTMRLLARPPSDAEQDILERSLHDFLDVFRSDAESADLLMTVGESPPPRHSDAPETAAWTLLTSQILNTDEFVTR